MQTKKNNILVFNLFPLSLFILVYVDKFWRNSKKCFFTNLTNMQISTYWITTGLAQLVELQLVDTF